MAGYVKTGGLHWFTMGRVIMGWAPGFAWWVRVGRYVLEGRSKRERAIFSERQGIHRFYRVPGTGWRVGVHRDTWR